MNFQPPRKHTPGRQETFELDSNALTVKTRSPGRIAFLREKFNATPVDVAEDGTQTFKLEGVNVILSPRRPRGYDPRAEVRLPRPQAIDGSGRGLLPSFAPKRLRHQFEAD